MNFETFLVLLGFVLGAFFGSFFNVVIVRLPRDESLVFPPSHCRKCGEPIRWYDNIPLASYIVLGGRCRSCKELYSSRYFFVELITALLFALVVRKYLPEVFQPAWWKGIGLIVLHFGLLGALVVVTFVDIDHQIIPNEITFPGIPIGLVASFVFPWQLQRASSPAEGLLWGAIAAVGAGGLLYLIGLLGKAWLKKEAMGLGDVKLMAMIGAFLGASLTGLTFILSSLVGAVVGVALIAVGRAEWQSRIPFGPYIVAGAVTSFFVGHTIVQWYWRTFFGAP